MYIFRDDILETVNYIIGYLDVPYAEAYSDIKNMVDKLELKFDGYKHSNNAIENLSAPDSQYKKTWEIGERKIAININYQDMSNAEYTNIDAFMVSIKVNV